MSTSEEKAQLLYRICLAAAGETVHSDNFIFIFILQSLDIVLSTFEVFILKCP